MTEEYQEQFFTQHVRAVARNKALRLIDDALDSVQSLVQPKPGAGVEEEANRLLRVVLQAIAQSKPT